MQPAALPAMKAPIVTRRLPACPPGSASATQKPVRRPRTASDRQTFEQQTRADNSPVRLARRAPNYSRLGRTPPRRARDFGSWSSIDLLLDGVYKRAACCRAGPAYIAGGAEECVAGTIAYVSNAASKDIFVFDMDPESGTLRLIERVPVPGTELPSPTSLPMAISPDRRFLYAALRSPPYAASSFAIDPASGRLSHLATTPLLCAMAYIMTDRRGRFLLAASYTDARLATYPIDSAGRIDAGPTQITPTGPNAHCVVVDSSNRFAYSAVLGADHVMQMRFDPDAGILTPNAPPLVATRAGSGPRHIALHPSGRYIHLLNQTDATIVAYRTEPGSGTLSEVETVATLPAHFLGEANAADVHPTPDGRFLYASERQTSTLVGFRIDQASGFLTPIGRWNTETTPRGFAIDPRGRFLLAAGLDSNRLSVHAIDPAQGTLTLHAQYQLGDMPNWVEIVDLP
jgi:6-phosphogluconolactonase